MLYKFFFVPVLFAEHAEAELNQFLAQHAIHAVDKQFSVTGEQSGWSFCVAYEKNSKADEKLNRKGSVDYREVLSPADFDVFAELRKLRKTLAEQQAIPPYAIFSNEQLAAMVTRKVTTMSELKAIDGVGQARLERYGEIFLKTLRDLQATSLHSEQVDV